MGVLTIPSPFTNLRRFMTRPATASRSAFGHFRVGNSTTVAATGAGSIGLLQEVTAQGMVAAMLSGVEQDVDVPVVEESVDTYSISTWCNTGPRVQMRMLEYSPGGLGPDRGAHQPLFRAEDGTYAFQANSRS